MLARFHAVAVEPDQIRHQYGGSSQLLGKREILLAAKAHGLKAKIVSTRFDRLDRTPLPAIAETIDGTFVILARVDADQVLYHDPRIGRPQQCSRDEWLAKWNDTLILFTSRATLSGDLARFDFSWFIPAIVKYRKLLSEVLLVSFFLQLIGLATPLFFQVVFVFFTCNLAT